MDLSFITEWTKNVNVIQCGSRPDVKLLGFKSTSVIQQWDILLGLIPGNNWY